MLDGQLQVDDACLGGERTDGKAWRGSENKVPFVAAVSFNDEGHPLRAKLTRVPGFTLTAIAGWAKSNLAPGSMVLSDGLACFSAVTDAGCVHQPTVVAGRKPKDLQSSSRSTRSWAISRPAFRGATTRLPSEIWRSVSRGFHLPIQPPIQSQNSQREAPGRRGSLRAAAPALDSGG